MDPKPERMKINWGEIPTDISEKKNWIVWKWEVRNGKWTKPPYQISGQPAKSNDPKTWNDYGRVYQAYKTGRWDGIGFMLENGYAGIDWDDVRNAKTGEIDPDFLKQIKYVNSYTEVSPRGNGVKTLLKADLPGKGHHNKNIGVFNQARYFCITGQALADCPKSIEARQAQLDVIVKHYWPADFAQKEKPATDDLPPIIQKALNSKDTKFKALWEGDATGYASPSEADQALCNKLAFWTGKDPFAIDALFRRSKLMRDKWNRDDYRKRTIDSAIAGAKETYGGKKKQDDKKRSAESITQQVRDYVDVTVGVFTTRQVYDDFNIREEREKHYVRTILQRLTTQGVIERLKKQAGTWRKVDSQVERMDLANVIVENIDLSLPLHIDNFVTFHPGNIVLIGGDTNSGKTAFLMNVAKDNIENFTVHYFSSEMGPQEMRARADLFDDFPVSHPRFNAYERTEDFADVIFPGRGNLNIIDYLELVEDFWIIAKWLKQIHEKLDGAIAVIGAQKRSPQSDDPLGGKRGLEKPRLVLAMRNGSVKIVKAKNWKTGENPNGLQADFRLAQGSKFYRDSDWVRPIDDTK